MRILAGLAVERLEVDLEVGRVEPVLFQVRRILIDDLADLEGRQPAGHVADIGARRAGVDRRCHLPGVAVFLDRGDVARFRRHRQFADFVRGQRDKHLVLLGRGAVALLLPGHEINVRAEPGEDERRARVLNRRRRIYPRLRHQLSTPAKNPEAGMMNNVSYMMLLCCAAVSVRRRSSASFGRIEIRFSCCDSQPIVFMKRSRLPRDAERRRWTRNPSRRTP